MGNKTTNAKARTGQTGGVKNIVKEFEKTQLKPTSTRKAKQKAPVLIDVKNDEPDLLDDDVPEPEYAPPRPVDLPFESDLVPREGLALEGLKKENLYRGFYRQFCNPIDDDGISAHTKRFNKEMEAMMEEAVDKNVKELEALDWNEADVEPSPKKVSRVPNTQQTAEAKMARKVRSKPAPAIPSGSMSRKAAVALAHQTGNSKSTLATRPVPRAGQTLTRKPLASIVSRRQPANKGISAKSSLDSSNDPTAGAIVSRNTLGYSRGKSASTALRPLAPSRAHSRGGKSPELLEGNDLTITPSRARRAGYGMQTPRYQAPQFTSIFDAQDEEELPPMVIPDMEDEEEDFELRLDD